MKTEKFDPSITQPLAIVIAMLILAGTVVGSEPRETVLHHFHFGTDGAAPYGRLISDAAGNLYGTTAIGGMYGAGTVFELTNPEAPAGWTESILYNFSRGSDGSEPVAGLIFDSAGNLYGTTFAGGAYNAGTVYELTPGKGGSWSETVLYSFAGGADGEGPEGDLTFDRAGNLFGTTTFGGSPGLGIVFELMAGQNGVWTETVLHSFMFNEGYYPRAGVIFDKNGSLYGTLGSGTTFRAGAVFRLKPKNGDGWTEETLYAFTGGIDGNGPICRLILFQGKLYGTTVNGGAFYNGAVFELSPPANHDLASWTETTLYSFKGGTDGYDPWAGLTLDSQGTFYGTTQNGGGLQDGGTVFMLKQEGGIWFEDVVGTSGLGSDMRPAGGQLLVRGATLYGTTVGAAGNGPGMVFEIRP
jgi:uncharacterized repeat protein (TIGR03803 family)